MADQTPLAVEAAIQIANADRASSKTWTTTATTWAEFVERLRPDRLHVTKSDTKAAKEASPAYVAGTVAGNGRRNRETVVSRSLVTLDLDGGNLSRADLVGYVELHLGCAAAGHTTYRSDVGALRWRLVLLPDREMDRTEAQRVTAWAMAQLEPAVGDVIDSGSLEPERCMFWPATHRSRAGAYDWFEVAGDPLSVDDVLAVAPEVTDGRAADPEVAVDRTPWVELSPERRDRAQAAVDERVRWWQATLTAAEDWPEGERDRDPHDPKARGWDALLRDAAHTLAGLVVSPWADLSVEAARELWDELVPEAMEQAVTGDKLGYQLRRAKRGEVSAFPPPWEDARHATPEDDFDELPDEPTAERAQRSPWADGGSFLFDQPDRVPTIWGDVEAGEVLWAEGEATMLAGPPGVGKTTLTGQLVRALLFGGDVLGWPVAPATGRVLYLAMDRPRQIARALRRHFEPGQRAELADRLQIWQGPPPGDMAKDPELMARLARKVGASHVVVDSLKDAALGLTEEGGAAGYNRARQAALADGVQVLELHHMVKRGANGKAPTTLADLYGGMPITAGAGSVVLLWGEAGDRHISLRHLKPILEPVPPADIEHDHTTGVSRRVGGHSWRGQVADAVAWMDEQQIGVEVGVDKVWKQAQAADAGLRREAVREAVRLRRARHEEFAS